ncbi:hypothetical protein CEUSTIGMA_g2086.t1 [Chlamydomonas eustigma]|uniref:Uncharacterized protein n=1 Tax=Chlamydomonas eustigma TaxID=1157962 RepID=A0A250WUY6_9CHLO|nr:hypothetical protein CEUSTIGMA_g2086.t1 [Chlamydomonas eustigma]|eukprot:GAX74638.1 hypothetical protein CEUSTIGMA_g2086.t1 [Chlamydomonas eustigma]
MESRIRELEKKLASVCQERDDLQKDVEALCLQNGSSMFSGSYVLAERVKALDADLKNARGNISSLQNEKDRLLEDVSNLKIAKIASETLNAQMSSRMGQLEKDVAYYQVQLSKVVAERDHSLFECDQLRAQAVQSDAICREERARAESEGAARASLEQKLSVLREESRQIRAELDKKLQEAEDVSRKLKQAIEEKKRSDASLAALQVKHDVEHTELERCKRQLSQAHESEARLRLKQQEQAAVAAQLQGTVSGQLELISQQRSQMEALRSDLATAQSTIKQHDIEQQATMKKLLDAEVALSQRTAQLEDEVQAGQAESRRLQQQLDRLNEVIHLQQQQQYEQSVNASTSALACQADSQTVGPSNGQEKQAGRMEIPMSYGQSRRSSRERSAAAEHPQGGVSVQQQQQQQHLGHSGVGEDEREQMEILTHMVRDLKIKLAQATQEKVEALMKVAASSPSSTRSSDAATAVGQQSRDNMVDGGLGSSPVPSTASSLFNFMSSRLNSMAGAAATIPSFHPLSVSVAPPLPLPAPLSTTAIKSSRVDGASKAADAASSLHNKEEVSSAPLLLLSPRATTAEEQASMKALSSSVIKLAAVAKQYSAQLKASGDIVWSHADVAKKWSAITRLSKIHEEINHMRATLNLHAPVGGGDVSLLTTASPSNKNSRTTMSAFTVQQQAERELTEEILSLTELCVKALEQYNRQEAMSSVGMQY